MKNAEAAYALNQKGAKCFTEGKFAEAIDAFHAAIDEMPNYADAYYNLGLALIRASERVEAVHVFEALLMLQPLHLGANFQLACIYMQREKEQTALQYFSVIEREYPEHVESLINMAACFLRLGRLAEARARYERVLVLQPMDAQSLYNLGVICAYQGRVREAIDFYLRAIKADHSMHAAHNNLAVVYLGVGDVANALLHFRAALALNPENAALRHSIRILTESEKLDASPADYIRSLFDSYADHYDVHLQQGLSYAVPKVLWQVFQEHSARAQLDVLDLGCGTGLCAEIFKPVAKSLVGVDLSEKMLAQAERKQLYDLLVVDDALAFLRDKVQQYDLIIAGDVLVYFGDLPHV